jgi:CRISPR system Cascade subunit CasD
MQSWGTRSQFDIRDTEMEPSKSGVLGLLCAACGIDRGDWPGLEPLTHLPMGVRVDRPGVLRKDYQTAQLHPYREDSETALSSRHYLSDASFLVGLEGEEALLRQLDAAVRNPHWALSLGRKSYPPSKPIAVGKDGVLESKLREALVAHELSPVKGQGRGPDTETPPIRLVLETSDAQGSLRYDVPISSFAERRFGSRYVVSEFYRNGGES